MPRKPIRAQAIVRIGGSQRGTSAQVPAAVREHLGVEIGDTLLFVEGSTWTAEEAARRGRYFVVRRASAAEMLAAAVAAGTAAAATAPEKEAASPVAPPPPSPLPLEPLQVSVERRLRGTPSPGLEESL